VAYLYPVSSDETSPATLYKFYKKLGFKYNRGKNKKDIFDSEKNKKNIMYYDSNSH
jgi:hypothetical protein